MSRSGVGRQPQDKTRTILSGYLKNIKDLKNFEINTDRRNGGCMEKAFTKAISVLNQWTNIGDTAKVDVSGKPCHTEVKGIHDALSKTRVLVSIGDGNKKRYYTLKMLEGIDTHANMMEAMVKVRENNKDRYYGGGPTFDESGTQMYPKTMGIHFFQQTGSDAGSLRKVPKGGIPNTRDYTFHDGAFWPYVSKIPIDLSAYQIFSDIQAKYYKDNCFVYALIQSGVFDKKDYDFIREVVKTKRFPTKDLAKFAEQLHCNFKISRIADGKQKKNRIYIIDTEKSLKRTYPKSVQLVLWKEHYFLKKDLPITKFYIEHYEEINENKFCIGLALEDKQRIVQLYKTKPPKLSDSLSSPFVLIDTMFECDRFRPIDLSEREIIKAKEYRVKLEDYTDLDYNPALCTRPIQDTKKEALNFQQIWYADFESITCTNPHKAYLCCYISDAGYKRSFRGFDCAEKFLESIPDKTLIYFHNLKYDASFFMNVLPNQYKVKIIERTGTILQLQFVCILTKRHFTFRNSYSIIPAPLRAFGAMFHLEIEKDVCPYSAYTIETVESGLAPLDMCLKALPDDQIEQFLENCNKLKCFEGESVKIMNYANYYCLKDCEVLRAGMRSFDKDLKQLFEDNGRDWIGLQSYISVSSIGYSFALKFGCLDGCYELAGKPQNFISRCVSGGRTMTANNEKLIIDEKLQDFDAVSLYPSAMYTMRGIPKGIPKVITDFGKLESYSDYFIEINIDKLQAKGVDHYKFPLVFGKENQSKVFRDKCYTNFYVDKRSLEDLIEFYDIEYTPIRGYYFDEGHNNRINTFIKLLFDLRKKYKSEGNALQNTIKLLLNSIYGKSILKPVETEIKVINPKNLERFIIQHYNYILEINEATNGYKKHIYAKVIKSINTHYNCPQFGVNVLSWSKHLMNRVMCLADQNGIPVFYQDTDSMHLKEEDVPRLGELFKEKYHTELIGTNLCQFHCDFDPIKEGVPVHSKKLIALGKKSYLDLLEDSEGNTSYHIRMKGVPQNVLVRYCEEHGISLEDLYMKLYNGETIKFNLLDGANCFRKNKFYEQYTPSVFFRTVKF